MPNFREYQIVLKPGRGKRNEELCRKELNKSIQELASLLSTTDSMALTSAYLEEWFEENTVVAEKQM